MSKLISIKSFIISYISLKILNNEYKVDQKVPSENIFADKFKCTRLTARSAILVLIHLGVLYAIKGSGHYVSENAIKILMPPLYLKNKSTSFINNKIETKNKFTTIESIYLANDEVVGKVFWKLNKNVFDKIFQKYSLNDDIGNIISKTGFIGVKVCESLVNIDNITYIKHSHYDEADNFLYDFCLWTKDIEDISSREYIKA